jgi:precorrin-4 methylase
MNTKEFEDNLIKANDVVLFSEDGTTVAHYTAIQALHHIYRMAGEIHEKLVNRDTPMLVVNKDGKERCPVCGCKIKYAFCPKCGQRLIYQEAKE